MKTLGFGRHALGIGLAVTMLAGCGGSQAGGPMPMGATVSQAKAQGPWMRPATSGGHLIYAEGGNACGGVCILSYPGGKLVGSIALSGGVGGDCSDRQGNIRYERCAGF